jgi:hypothetical protein
MSLTFSLTILSFQLSSVHLENELADEDGNKKSMQWYKTEQLKRYYDAGIVGTKLYVLFL